MKNFDTLNSQYDRLGLGNYFQTLYDKSGYMNYGYWGSDYKDDSAMSLKVACDKLVDKLIDFIPQKKGTILDVACGQGATTRRLKKYFKPSNISAINISEKQLQAGRERAKGCNFMLMDAADLMFKNNSFSNIISVEAAFHFMTRENFINEAFRVLKPGGRLVMSDFLFSNRLFLNNKRFPKENIQGDRNKYKEIFLKAGFSDVVIENVTEETWNTYEKKIILKSLKVIMNSGWSFPRHISGFLFLLMPYVFFVRNAIKEYMFVSAYKS